MYFRWSRFRIHSILIWEVQKQFKSLENQIIIQITKFGTDSSIFDIDPKIRLRIRNTDSAELSHSILLWFSLI